MTRNKSTHSFALIPDMSADIEGTFHIEVPEQVPILPIRRQVAFPLIMLPVLVGRKSSKRLIHEACDKNLTIGIFAQRNSDDNNPDIKGLQAVGVAGRVVKIIEMPDNNNVTAILQCVSRIVLTGLTTDGPYYTGTVMPLPEDQESDDEFRVLCGTIRERGTQLFAAQKDLPPEVAMSISHMENDIFLVNFLCSTLPFSRTDKERMLHATSIKKRAMLLLKLINEMLNLANLRASIEEKTQSELTRQQREYFLHQEMKTIQEELGESPTTADVEKLTKKAKKAHMPDHVQKAFDTELGRLQHTNAQSPEYNMQLSYLQTVVDVPWRHTTKDNLNLNTAERVLNRRHYGMQPVKDRILEHLAVMKLRGDMKSPIICLYGPPGVGKTSLGQSIADALHRKYVRASLGGMHDESEIRGHRRTYIGAMPGRIIKGMIKAGSVNPVFILDEIDKIAGMTYNGDPSSALLEVLDPEQNVAFHDNYLDLDYDLSNVMFIATANDITRIPKPLLDRMELIQVPGYKPEEKVEIARRHLVPRALEATGLASAGSVRIGRDALETIINKYTHEKGVRTLEQRLQAVCRKVALQVARNADTDGQSSSVRIDSAKVIELLGTEAGNPFGAVKGFNA